MRKEVTENEEKNILNNLKNTKKVIKLKKIIRFIFIVRGL